MGAQNPFYVDMFATHPSVTGSLELAVVKYPDGTTTRFIVDCGMFQEEDYSKYNEDFPFEASKVDFALVTHVHVDHIGRMPLLAKQGFRGKIYSSIGSQILANPAIHDSYKVLKDTAKRKNVRPLYSETDAELSLSLWKGYPYKETIQIDSRIKVTFFKNGHLTGASIILVQISYPGYEDINLLFTGDYNNKNMFFDVPNIPKWVQRLPLTIVQESTYGTMDSDQIEPCFEKNILECLGRKGTAVCMAFSLGRSQEVLYILKKMQENGQLDVQIPIYFDGKLAHKYTRLYQTQTEELGIKASMKDFLPENIFFVDKSTRKDVLNSQSSKVIVTTSGMGTYGPSQVYIPEYITRKDALLQFTGYTTEGTLGARLKNTEFGDFVEVGSILRKKYAQVEYTTEFSAHAKADEMIDFLNQFEQPKLILVNHGEPDVKVQFAKRVLNEVDPKDVAIMNRDYFFRINPYGLVRQMTTKFT